MSTEESPEVKYFSLVKGGPFYKLMQRIGLVKRDTGKFTGEVWFLGLLAWLPLVILSVIDGVVIGRVRIPLLYDYSALVRFLLALPLLLAIEPVIDRWINSTVRQFRLQDIIEQADVPVFEAAVRRAENMRDLPWMELLLVAAAYIGSYLSITVWLASPIPSWYILSPGSRQPSLAGWWYILFSLPLWQFLLYRWLWRLFIWYVLLWKISRLDLRLIAIHPDLACGLGFLKYAQIVFSLVAFAMSSIVVSVIGNRIAYAGQSFSAVYLPMTGMVVVSLVILLGPLLFFTRKLITTKRTGTYTYGTLAEDYTQRFDAKWVKHENPQNEELLGTSDIQSLADLANSYNIVRNTKAVPFDLNAVLSIVVMVLIPLIPLVLGVLPLEEIVASLLRVLM